MPVTLRRARHATVVFRHRAAGRAPPHQGSPVPAVGALLHRCWPPSVSSPRRAHRRRLTVRGSPPMRGYTVATWQVTRTVTAVSRTMPWLEYADAVDLVAGSATGIIDRPDNLGAIAAGTVQSPPRRVGVVRQGWSRRPGAGAA